jgi:caa(3)-type oxidase subunit IV
MTMAEAAHHSGYKGYLIIWVWLLVMTMLALGAGEFLPSGIIKTLALVGITLAKVVLIAAFFMHLKAEKLNLIMITFAPIILALIMFFFMSPDMGDSATRTLYLR